MEQLATFMGHILYINKQVYRLPDEVLQTENIAKVLMLMKGERKEVSGKVYK